MKLNKLSAVDIPRKPPGNYGDGGGLFLQVAPSGARTWTFRFTSPTTGKRREMGLGGTAAVPLAKARKLAADARALLAQGADPIEHRDALEAAKAPAPEAVPTFAAVAAETIASRAASWKSDRQRQVWEASLLRYCVAIWNRPIDSITRSDVEAILRPIWTVKSETGETKVRELATRVRERMERVFGFAIARGWYARANPATWRDGLDALLTTQNTKSERHPSLKWQEAALFMTELRSSLSTTRLALELLILTACRAGEVAGARWEEIDLPSRTWVIPAARMKAKRPHRVPLPARAVQLLEFLPRSGPGVFVGLRDRTTMHPESLRRCLQRDLGREDLSVHGWRRTFRTWCRDTGKSRELAELQLAHEIGSAVESAYTEGADALEQRRELMEAWSAFLSGAAQP